MRTGLLIAPPREGTVSNALDQFLESYFLIFIGFPAFFEASQDFDENIYGGITSEFAGLRGRKTEGAF